MKSQLPQGFSIRPASMADVEQTVEMLNAASLAAMGVAAHTASDQASIWSEPGFDLECDARLVLDPSGKTAAYYEVWDPTEPHVHISIWGQVHPQFTGLGIGSYLLAWAEERARLSMEKAPVGARITLNGYVLSTHDAAIELFQDHGYQLIRYSLRMVIDLPESPADPVWPQNIRVAPMRQGTDDAAIVDAVRQSFQDHWGYVERPFEDDLALWKHRMETDERFDPALWFIAWDGDQVAGISLCAPWWFDDRDLGWVSTLGVLRPWRRKGLGMALLQHSFKELYNVGRRKVGLGVDAESLTGATRLYQKAGMNSDPKRQYALFQKELRPGVELGTDSA